MQKAIAAIQDSYKNATKDDVKAVFDLLMSKLGDKDAEEARTAMGEAKSLAEGGGGGLGGAKALGVLAKGMGDLKAGIDELPDKIAAKLGSVFSNLLERIPLPAVHPQIRDGNASLAFRAFCAKCE